MVTWGDKTMLCSKCKPDNRILTSLFTRSKGIDPLMEKPCTSSSHTTHVSLITGYVTSNDIFYKNQGYWPIDGETLHIQFTYHTCIYICSTCTCSDKLPDQTFWWFDIKHGIPPPHPPKRKRLREKWNFGLVNESHSVIHFGVRPA